MIKKSPNEFGLKAAFKKPKVLGQSPKGPKVLKTQSSQVQKDIFNPLPVPPNSFDFHRFLILQKNFFVLYEIVLC